MKLVIAFALAAAVAGDCVLEPGYHLVPATGTANAGDLTCQPCPPNTYGYRDTAQTDPQQMFKCMACAAGKYAIKRGSVECIANTCAAGEMRIVEGTTDSATGFSCFTCPTTPPATAALYTQDSDNKCFCNQGAYLADGQCKPCPVGTYQDEAKQDECKPCAVGTMNFVTGSKVACTAASTCAAGTYMSGSNAGAAVCSPCAINEFSADGALSCKNCPNGQYSDANSGSCNQNTCTAGTFRNAGGACENCIQGTYTDQDGQTQCKTCPGSSTTAHAGAKSAHSCRRSDCPAGTASEHGTCQPCAKGKFSTGTGNLICSTCAQGTYSYQTGMDNCPAVTNCPAGQYTTGANDGGGSNPNQAVCANCPAGKYSTTEGSHSCRTCEDQKWQWNEGQTSCGDISCDIGSFKPDASTACQLCSAGKFQDKQNQVTCNTCPRGKWQWSQGQAECSTITCPAGEKGIAGGGCEPCGANTIAPLANSASCDTCPTGTHATGTGNTKCVETVCAPGQRVSDGDGRTCVDCDAGYFSPTRGTQTACQACPAGTTTTNTAVADGKGQSACWKAAGSVPSATTQVNYRVCGDDAGTGSLPLQCAWHNSTTLTSDGTVPHAAVSPGWHFVLKVTHRDSSTNGHGNTNFNGALEKHKCGMVLKAAGQYACRCWCWTEHAVENGMSGMDGDYHVASSHDAESGKLTNPFADRAYRNPAADSVNGANNDRTNLNSVKFKDYTGDSPVTHTKSSYYNKYQ